MVHLDVLLPADLPLPGQRITLAANVLSHLNLKQFSSFFLYDSLAKADREKLPAPCLEKADALQEMEAGAKSLNLEIRQLEPSRNPQLLHHQSLFADILFMSFLTADDHLPGYLISSKFLDRVGCPVLFSFGNSGIPREVFLYFDFEPSCLVAFKSFASIFGERLQEAKVTIATTSPPDENAIYMEKCLIQYAQRKFKDVGIIPAGSLQIEENLISWTSQVHNPWLIVGKMGLPFIDHHRIALTKNPFSVYSCNQ